MTDSNMQSLVYAHTGTNPYDWFFLKRFVTKFNTCLVTFTVPTQVPDGVRVIRLRDLGRPTGFLRLNNLRIAFATPWRILQFMLCLKNLRPGILIGNWTTTYGLYASLSGVRPFILFAWGTDIVVDANRSFLHRWITRRVIKSADFVVIDSMIQRTALLSLGCPEGKIICFPWIDLNDLKHIRCDSDFRRLLGWTRNTIVVSVRMLEPRYSVATLIHAIPMVIKKYPNARFLIFGTGSEQTNLARLVTRLGISKFVHFAGVVPRNKLIAYVKDCDIYVSTSLTDGTSSSLLEAMFNRKTVIVTRIPGNEEWVVDGVNGLTFSPDACSELANLILRIASNSDEAFRLSNRAAADIRRRINWENAFKRFVSKVQAA